MDLNFYYQQLEATGAAIRSLTNGLTIEQARWRPNPESWSLLEVINHLYDEEREDFRAHLSGLFQNPPQPWSIIDPQQWVKDRRYNETDLHLTIDNFLRERSASLAWLLSLKSPNWQAAYEGPSGKLTAAELLVSWAAHDLLHLRQLVELRYACLALAAEPDSLRYAGDW
jgi:hypothetical protein